MPNSPTVTSKDEPAINMSGITNSITSITAPVSARAQLITEVLMLTPRPNVYFKGFLPSSLICFLLATSRSLVTAPLFFRSSFPLSMKKLAFAAVLVIY
jgi:hypothetical protein